MSVRRLPINHVINIDVPQDLSPLRLERFLSSHHWPDATADLRPIAIHRYDDSIELFIQFQKNMWRVEIPNDQTSVGKICISRQNSPESTPRQPNELEQVLAEFRHQGYNCAKFSDMYVINLYDLGKFHRIWNIPNGVLNTVPVKVNFERNCENPGQVIETHQLYFDPNINKLIGGQTNNLSIGKLLELFTGNQSNQRNDLMIVLFHQ